MSTDEPIFNIDHAESKAKNQDNHACSDRCREDEERAARTLEEAIHRVTILVMGGCVLCCWEQRVYDRFREHIDREVRIAQALAEHSVIVPGGEA